MRSDVNNPFCDKRMPCFDESVEILKPSKIKIWIARNFLKSSVLQLHRLHYNRYLLIIKEEFIMACKKGTGKKPVKK
jgi:hypothetical protein